MAPTTSQPGCGTRSGQRRLLTENSQGRWKILVFGKTNKQTKKTKKLTNSVTLFEEAEFEDFGGGKMSPKQ